MRPGRCLVAGLALLTLGAACSGTVSSRASPTDVEVGVEDGGGVGEPGTPDGSTLPDGGTAWEPPDAGEGPAPDAGRIETTFAPTTAVIPNPERGFYNFIGSLESLQDGDLTYVAQAGHRLVYTPIRLDAFRTSAISAERLTAFDEGFAVIRRAGLKLLVRFTYNYPASESEYQGAEDASLSQVLAHLQQLAPLLQKNADVIAFVQAGFVGAWGEWHTSSNDLTAEPARTSIKDALLAALPAGRFVQFRYPAHVSAWEGTPPSHDALLAGARAPMGLHNDCFLSSPSDVGTYPEVEAEPVRAFARALSGVAPFGGETCAAAPVAERRTACADIRREGAEYHLTHLNAEYDLTFHDRWRSEGCYDEVSRSMGHRLRLTRVVHPERAAPGSTLSLSVALANDGWSRLHNPRPLDLLLLGAQGTVAHRVRLGGIELRRIAPGQTLSFDASAVLPSSLPSGRYRLALASPDAAATLATDARYALRPANADDAARGQRWDAAGAYFELGSELRID